MNGRSFSASRRASLILASALVALLIVEIALRNIGGVFHDTFTQLDLDRGWVLRPGFAGWMAEENTLWVRINSDGMRDREHALTAAPRTVRIAILGDSYMQGLNVPLEKTFASFLQARMDRCVASRGAAVETLNFGVSGYGTAQELLTYRLHASKYSPQVVLLAFYAGNDILNNDRRLNPNDRPEYSPYFVLREGRLELDTSFRESVSRAMRQPLHRRARMWVTDHVRTAQLAYQWWGGLRARLIGAAPPVESEADESAAMIDAWNVTEALLLQLQREVVAAGAELWVMTLPTPKTSSDQDDDRLRDFANGHGLPVISLARPMAAVSAEKKIALNGGYNARVPFGSGHLNERGNELAAEIAGHELCSSSPAVNALLR